SQFDRLDTTAKEITTALTRNQCRHGFIGGSAASHVGGARITEMWISSLMKTRQTSDICCFRSLVPIVHPSVLVPHAEYRLRHRIAADEEGF
ncbi:hypothetical protein N7501_010827, partial [Penicillium viridicatum]